MGKNPAFQFYPNDWLGDNQLQMTSTSTKGIWIQFLCRMWWAEDKGTVSGTRQQLCQLSGCNPAELEIFLAENTLLNFAGVTEHDKLITVVNRRMQREELARKSNTSRQARFRNAHSNATVTPPSPSPSTPSPSPTPKQVLKTLATVVDKSTPWPTGLDDVRTFLVSIQAPDSFFNQTYWLRIDQWLGGNDSAVYYFEELKAYLAWIASQNGHRKHKDLLRGFRNWLSTCARWKERDAQRKAVQRSHEQHSDRR
jgi:hypothetical protein